MERCQNGLNQSRALLVRPRKGVLVAVLAVASVMAAGVAHAIPEILSAAGCDASGSGAGTVNCPTRQGPAPISLTINGSSFTGAGAHAYVGGAECVVISATDSTVVCELPDGTGADVDVVVTDPSGIPSLPARVVSYAAPTILTIRGCSFDEPDGSATSGCARTGGTILTVIGQSFGDAGRVIVGGEECNTVAADDDEITCSLRPGRGVDRQVLVLAANQLSSGSSYKVSYAQCPPGTSDGGGLACTDCDDDEFSSSYDSTSCEPCPTGTFSVAGSAACTGPSGFQCWQAKDLKTPKFAPIEGFSVSDSLDGDGVVDVKKPALQCRAATTGASGEPPLSVGFTCYQVKGDSLDPPVPVSVTDPSGTEIDVELKNRKYVCGSTSHF